MLLKCCLLHTDIVFPRHDILCIFVSVYLWVYLILIYMINPFFGDVCQKFSLMVLLSFCLILCQFQPSIAYKSAVYKKGCKLLKFFSTIFFFLHIRETSFYASYLVQVIRHSGTWRAFNSFMTEAVIIEKPVHWFAPQINGLVSVW